MTTTMIRTIVQASIFLKEKEEKYQKNILRYIHESWNDCITGC